MSFLMMGVGGIYFLLVSYKLFFTRISHLRRRLGLIRATVTGPCWPITGESRTSYDDLPCLGVILDETRCDTVTVVSVTSGLCKVLAFPTTISLNAGLLTCVLCTSLVRV